LSNYSYGYDESSKKMKMGGESGFGQSGAIVAQ
jgi:hypothetical protein